MDRGRGSQNEYRAENPQKRNSATVTTIRHNDRVRRRGVNNNDIDVCLFAVRAADKDGGSGDDE